MKLIGGIETINVSKWREWIPTVKRGPRAISYDLLPIDQLVSANSEQRKALEQAAAHFRTQADINERTKISKLQANAKPSSSLCQKRRSKRSLNSDLLQIDGNRENKSDPSAFQFTEEARKVLCPFVGTEGMRCFDGKPVRPAGRTFDSSPLNLPIGVGISLDRITGRLLAPAVRLTHSVDGIRTWTDGHSGTLFNMLNEAAVGSPRRETAAYDVHGIRVFHNVSELDLAWRKTFAEGSVRGGELARAPDMLDYYDR